MTFVPKCVIVKAIVFLFNIHTIYYYNDDSSSIMSDTTELDYDFEDVFVDKIESDIDKGILVVTVQGL